MPDLDALFFCEHNHRQLAVRHCLRRQVERLEITVHKPGGREVSAETGSERRFGPSTERSVGTRAYEHCATTCDQGREIRRLADVPVRACEACGSGLVGPAAEVPCALCESRQAHDEGRAMSSFAPVPSTRIWTKEVPDPPLIPPQQQSPSPAPVTEERECPVQRGHGPLSPAPTNPIETPRKKEEAMPTGHRTGGPCPGCGVTGTRCKDGCPTKSAPSQRERTKTASKQKTAERSSAPVRSLGDLSDDELINAIEDARTELKRRKEETTARLERLRRWAGDDTQDGHAAAA